jgi:hypothetical protein
VASRPGQGHVVARVISNTLVGADKAGGTQQGPDAAHSGAWRPNMDFEGEGLKVTMRRAKGLTPPGILAVPMRLQVPPLGDLSREWSFEYAKFTTLRKGERSRPQGPPLQTLSISTMLMDAVAQDDAMGFVVWPHAPDPQRVLRELRWIMGEARGSTPAPFRLTISEMAVWDEFLTNGTYVLTRVAATQKQTRGTEYVDLGFEEYDPLDAGQKAQGKDKADLWHKLKPGDELYELAKHYGRSPSKWRAIAKANGINSSVDPGSPANLAAWAKRNNRKALKIPGSIR